MLPHTHFLAAFLLGLIGQQYGLLQLVHVLAAGIFAVLVDIDHYIMFFRETRSWNIRDFWNHCTLDTDKNTRNVLHHKPAIFFILFISFFLFFITPPWSFALLIGYFSHLLLDVYTIEGRRIETEPHYAVRVFGFSLYLYKLELVFSISLLLLIIYLL